MKNSILMGTLLVAIALAPQAAAGSQSYTADALGVPVPFDISGTLLSPPMLQQSTGTAVIVDAVFNPVTERWFGHIECLVGDANGKCTGTVSS